MPAAPAPRARRRSWPQRLVIAAGAVVVLGCAAAAGAAGYVGIRLAQIDRVDDIALHEVAAGDPVNVLLVGTDSREGIDVDDPDSGGFLGAGEQGCDCTDTIMVLRIDPQAQEAYLLSFPRDLWLPIADTGRQARINSAHARGEQVLIDTIRESFGVPIHHYVEVDFMGFQRMVDAVGGVPLWFDAPVRDTHTGLSVPEAGCQVLDGQQARRFVRSRYLEHRGDDGRWRGDPTADLGRITRQQIFIRRAVAKAVSRGLTNPVTLNELVSAGVANVRLDGRLDAGDILALGRRFAAFDADELIGYSIPSDPIRTSAGADVELADMKEAEPILNIFRGLPPGTVTPQAIDVSVLNGTGIDGKAADTAGALAEIGFHVLGVDTYAEPVGRTTVLYPDGGQDMARQLARHLTGGAALVHDSDVGSGRVVLVVGADFTTVHDQPAPEGSPDDLRTTTSTSSPSTTDASAATSSTTTVPEMPTTSEPVGYATGEPPAGTTCG